jgi:hypothetical protein
MKRFLASCVGIMSLATASSTLAQSTLCTVSGAGGPDATIYCSGGAPNPAYQQGMQQLQQGEANFGAALGSWIGEAMAERQAAHQAELAARSRYWASEVDAFAADPAWPRFAELREEMLKLFMKGKAPTLAQAYAMAMEKADRKLTPQQRLAAQQAQDDAEGRSVQAHHLAVMHTQSTQAEAQQQAQYQQMVTAVNVFAADPAHPYFQQVRERMADLVQTGRATSLQQAYDMALAERAAPTR